MSILPGVHATNSSAIIRDIFGRIEEDHDYGLFCNQLNAFHRFILTHVKAQFLQDAIVT